MKAIIAFLGVTVSYAILLATYTVYIFTQVTVASTTLLIYGVIMANCIFCMTIENL